ncbi:MAG: hypothetical protein NC548_44655 [Lachnospiraceae bacterium]|nr:hypothetical protein [Lachnospiraceae bacterium]
MRANKNGKVVYISDCDVYLVQSDVCDGHSYNVYCKYDGSWLGMAFDEDVPDFMRFRLGLRTWGGE